MTAVKDVRVMIVDDHPIVVQGLTSLLEGEGLRVVSALDSTATLVDDWANHRPSVCLVDINVPPDGNSLTAIRHLTDVHPTSVVVAMSAQGDPALINSAIDAGAVGYLSKVADPWEIAPLLSAAALGELVFDRRSASLVYRSSRSRHAASQAVGFTAREIAILEGVARGMDNQAIARLHSVSRSTVASTLSVIFRRLDVRDRAQAVAVAIRLGLIDPFADDPGT